MNPRKFLIPVGVLFAVMLLGFVAYHTEWQLEHLGPITAFLLLPLVPLGLPIAAGVIFQRSRAAVVTCFAGLITAFGILASLFVYVFYLNPDPQGGLVLVFGPIYAVIGLIPFGIVALIFFLRASP